MTAGPLDPDNAPGGAEEKSSRDVGSQSDELEARLALLRGRLEELDGELIGLVGLRRDLVLEVGRVKGRMGRPILDPVREARVVRRAAERARAAGVDEELIRDVIWRIMASARDAQTGRTGWGPPEPPDGTD